MGTFNASFYPASSGLNLGNASQKWDAYIRSLFVDNIYSNSVNPSTTGAIRLASADYIGWRNNSNSADLSIAKTGAASGNVPADTLVWNGGGIEAAAFISSASNPADAGAVRLTATDVLNFRNQANSGNVPALTHNSDDSIAVGGAAGLESAVLSSTSANPALAGVVRLGNGESINWRNAGNSANFGLTGDSNDRIANDAPNGLLLTGASPNILLGGATAGFPMLKRNATAINLRLADDSADAPLTAGGLTLSGGLTLNSGVSMVNGIAAVGPGVGAIVATTGLVAQTLAITTTTLLAVGLNPTSPGGGLYRLDYYADITNAGNAVNLTVTLGWTDDSAPHTLTTANIACNTLGANSTSALGLGSITFFGTPATNITYATALSGAIGAGTYALRLRLTYLG